MYQRHITGKIGEDIACQYLIENNYQILERNFECRQGELDIIVKDKNEIVFIEVKTRTNNKYGSPIESITYLKQKHIIRSIQYYLYKRKLENEFVRIDVMEIYGQGKNFHIKHIKNAISL